MTIFMSVVTLVEDAVPTFVYLLFYAVTWWIYLKHLQLSFKDVANGVYAVEGRAS